MPVVRGAARYFAIVFAAGFVLGVLRTLFLVPWLGVRAAELIEIPVMLVVVVLAARHVHRRHRELPFRAHLAIGLLALLALLAAEIGLGAIEGRSPAEVLAGRDPVAAAAYYCALAVFALLPAWFGRRSARATRGPCERPPTLRRAPPAT